MNQNSIYGLKGVIAIDLIEALQKQMNFCENKEKYKCGIYVENSERIKIVANVISNLLPVPNRKIELRINRYDAEARWQNGSIIRIMNTILQYALADCNFDISKFMDTYYCGDIEIDEKDIDGWLDESL